MTVGQPTYICDCCNHTIVESQIGYVQHTPHPIEMFGGSLPTYLIICIRCLDKYNYEQQHVEDPFE